MNREDVMRQWDSWRKYIAEGGGGSWPRDAFEALLDSFEDKIERLRDGMADQECHIEAQHQKGLADEAEIDRLRAQWGHFQKLTSEHRDELEAEIKWLRQRLRWVLEEWEDTGGQYLTHTTIEKVRAAVEGKEKQS